MHVWDEFSEFLPENRVFTSADFNTYPIRIFILLPWREKTPPLIDAATISKFTIVYIFVSKQTLLSKSCQRTVRKLSPAPHHFP